MKHVDALARPQRDGYTQCPERRNEDRLKYVRSASFFIQFRDICFAYDVDCDWSSAEDQK